FPDWIELKGLSSSSLERGPFQLRAVYHLSQEWDPYFPCADRANGTILPALSIVVEGKVSYIKKHGWHCPCILTVQPDDNKFERVIKTKRPFYVVSAFEVTDE